VRHLDERSIELREKILDMVAKSHKGHIKSAFSCLEIVRVLYDDILKPDDKCILSKGHGCLAQYIMLAEKGYFPEGELYTFCNDGALLGGHPSAKIPGVEIATGSLGHGLSVGIGFALMGHDTYVILGDGECNEGAVWEAAMCASKHHLNNLTGIIDYNKQQSYGADIEVMSLSPFVDKWRSFGWDTVEVDGHNVKELCYGFSWNSGTGNPKVIIANTIKGRGIKLITDNPRWHYRDDITDEEINKLYEALYAENLF
jgi:transketolase